jgi:hypothetical protein
MQMNLRIVIGIIAFCAALSGVILANMFVNIMIGEINRKKEDGRLISYFGFTSPKVQRIFAEYRRLYRSWQAAHLCFGRVCHSNDCSNGCECPLSLSG